jgi:hypothetical protein
MLVEKYRVTRDITPEECHWLSRTYKKGEILYEYIGYTYGCISPKGIAICDNPDGVTTPFHEFPKNAIEIVNQP